MTKEFDDSMIPCLTPGNKLEKKRIFNGKTRYRVLNSLYATVAFFNLPGYNLFKAIDGTKSILELCKAMAGANSTNFDNALSEVSQFIEHLKKQKFIYFKNSEEPPPILETTYMIKPEEIWLNVTSRCNLQCMTCFKDEDQISRKDMSKEKLFELIDEVKQLGAGCVIVSGGEPFMRPDILDILNYISSQELVLIIITNGTLINETIAKRLGEIKPKIIQVSLDGSTAEINDKIRGKGSYDKTIRAAKLLLQQNLDVRLYPTVTRLNIHDLPNMRRLVNKLRPGFDHLAFAKFHPTGRGLKHLEELHVPEDEFSEMMIEFTRQEYIDRTSKENCGEIAKQQQEEDLGHLLPSRVAYGARKINCGLGTGTLSIEADGKVYPCHWLHFKEFQAGDLYEHSLPEIYYNSQTFSDCKMMRVDSSFEDCHKCDYRYFCGGGCRARALFEEGNIRGKDPNCNAHFSHFDLGLWTDKMSLASDLK